MAKLIKMVCATCGSDDVKADAYATWNTETQEWECAQTFDKGAYCNKCDGETTLEEKPLRGDDRKAARARELALADGWQPGDEDTAAEYCAGNGIVVR